jgi:hypothetical protein
MRNLAKPIALLASLALLTGCSNGTALIAVDELCRSWRHQPVHKGDKLTEKTASVIEGNNDSRPAWGCTPGENRAGS